MNQLKIFFFLIILLIPLIQNQTPKISLKTIDVEEGIYNIVLNKRYSILTYLSGLRTSREKYGFSRLNFRISYVDINNKKYFFIYHLHTGLYIGINNSNNNNIDNFPILANNDDIMELNKKKNNYDNFQWEFVKKDGKVNIFTIKNKLGCSLIELKSKFICTTTESGTLFSLLKLYEEVPKNMTEEDKKILDNEPIDVFIKYIDLSDPNLTRNNLTQIKKDEENEELRYSIRSILQNIPWIRKIFILMPNEKVRFLKKYNEINDKIIYVNDKDILEHESSNIHAFQYRIWKLREFGLSENFISMDDDYFIGKPMKKSDFFYVENKKVVPAIINTNFEVQTINSAKYECGERKKKMDKNKRRQTSDEFMYMVYRTYIFLIEYFNSPIIVPYFTHNAIPVNANDLKEVFDLVNSSEEFKEPTLYSLYRNPQSLQYQTNLIVYIYNKYRRKVNKINYNYIDGADTIKGNFDFPLFCINTGNNKDYSTIAFMKMKVTMEKLFPFPTKYEIYNPKILAENAFNVVKRLGNELKKLTDEKVVDKYEKEQFENKKISRKYDVCNNQLDFLKAEKLAYKTQIEKIKSKLEKCKVEYDSENKKLEEFKKLNDDFRIISGIRKEINDVNIDNNKYEKKLNKYDKTYKEYLNKIKKSENNEKKLYFIIYFQIVLIIAILILIGFISNKDRKMTEEKVEIYGYNSIT